MSRATKDVEFYCASFDLYEKFAGVCPLSQTPTQKFESEFSLFGFQEIGSNLVSLKRILKSSTI